MHRGDGKAGSTIRHDQSSRQEATPSMSPKPSSALCHDRVRDPAAPPIMCAIGLPDAARAGPSQRGRGPGLDEACERLTHLRPTTARTRLRLGEDAEGALRPAATHRGAGGWPGVRAAGRGWSPRATSPSPRRKPPASPFPRSSWGSPPPPSAPTSFEAVGPRNARVLFATGRVFRAADALEAGASCRRWFADADRLRHHLVTVPCVRRHAAPALRARSVRRQTARARRGGAGHRR